LPSSAFTRPRISSATTTILALLCLSGASADASAPVYEYEVVGVYPHAVEAFTQGLIFADSSFYEGTGLYGESSLRKVEVETGIVLKQRDLPAQYFGEGITALRDTIYQLTFTNHVGFTYVERDTFELIETFPYAWSGWGLTHNGTQLIASDGTSTIRFLDPHTREEISSIQVQDDGVPVTRLNELEYIQGKIYSNVWFSNQVAVIDPVSGGVEAWLDLGGLRDSVAYYPQANVLNGIAFDPEETRLFVTGKRWPKLFEIDVVPLHPSGIEDATSLSLNVSPVLRSFPNPWSGRTQFTFELPGEGAVSLRIFDIGGRVVRTLVNGWRGAGEHAMTVDGGGLPPGAYFVTFVSEGVTETRKVVVLR
jgi:glutaminyl-peptide cyclotransferase